VSFFSVRTITECDGIPDSSFSQNDTIAKSMAKSLAVKRDSFDNKRTRELG
jgi:DNA mismatch repair protein MutL